MGLVYADGVVLTTVRALGREDGLHVRRDDGQTFDAELAGWDPTTSLAVLRVAGLGAAPIAQATAPARVGHLALAVARSWSNAVTASAGIVSVIGGPLPTGRRRAIDQVIRTTAPMHDGFAGGAFLDTSGGLLGVTTAAAIRGLAVVIPAAIAWKTASTLLEHGQLKRGYLGIAGQPVRLPENQSAKGRDQALLVVGVTAGSPAAAAGVLVGDVLLEFDGHAIQSPEDLLDLLVGDRVGRDVTLRVLPAGTATDVTVTGGEIRPTGRRHRQSALDRARFGGAQRFHGCRWGVSVAGGGSSGGGRCRCHHRRRERNEAAGRAGEPRRCRKRRRVVRRTADAS
jgi:S1-C subfamily serine protease